MPALSEYSNVYSTAIAIIERKGYQVWYDRKTDLFAAEKSGWDFMSDSPCGLLGLIAMYEDINPADFSGNWWKNPHAKDYNDLPGSPVPYVPVWKREY